MTKYCKNTIFSFCFCDIYHRCVLGYRDVLIRFWGQKVKFPCASEWVVAYHVGSCSNHLYVITFSIFITHFHICFCFSGMRLCIFLTFHRVYYFLPSLFLLSCKWGLAIWSCCKYACCLNLEFVTNRRNQTLMSTQPGHPFMGRSSEYQWKLGRKQAHRVMHQPHIRGLAV